MNDTLPEIYLAQATRRNLELAKSFQRDMDAHFLEHAMFDIKDALTSILALCDMEDMKQVPSVKKYIQNITEQLEDVVTYQSNAPFSVSHVLINVINIIKNHYKGRAGLTYELNQIKASAECDKNHLEQILLYLIIEVLETGVQKQRDLKLALYQLEKNAAISIKVENFQYSSAFVREIMAFYKQDAFRLQISDKGSYTEVLVQVPLTFGKRQDKEAGKPSISLELGELKRVEAEQEQHEKESREAPRVYSGAQERT